MRKLKDYAAVRQGAITGADDVFIVDTEDVPKGEEEIYQPFLPDRMIGRYSIPRETGKRVFYPFINDESISGNQVETDFPLTWSRLQQHKEKLAARLSVASKGLDWWRPIWPRPPREMLVTKIAVPELFLVPRFGLDTSGKWVVSHSPFVYNPRKEAGEDILFILTALLNSSVSAWFIDLNARKYRSQYNKIAGSLLRQMPIPDLGSIPLNALRKVIALTRSLVEETTDVSDNLGPSLDEIILRDLYGLSEEEVALIIS